MKKIDAFVNSDGTVHTSLAAAKRHAEKRYGDLLLKLAHGAVEQEKYVKMTEWLNDNLPRFVELSELKKDLDNLDDETDY